MFGDSIETEDGVYSSGAFQQSSWDRYGCITDLLIKQCEMSDAKMVTVQGVRTFLPESRPDKIESESSLAKY
jgi:hypothetical protein